MSIGYSSTLPFNMSVTVLIDDLRSTFLEFERDIDDIFGEINAYIPQFTTRSDTPTGHEKLWCSIHSYLWSGNGLWNT